jgi:hypothetical protein
MSVVREKEFSKGATYTRCQDFSFPNSRYGPKVGGLVKHHPKTVDEPDENMIHGFRALVNVVFIVGALASTADGVITAIVVLRVGVKIEGNSVMGAAMRFMGVIPLCSLRIIIGIGLFWVFRSYTIGRRYFWTKKGAIRYASRFSKIRPRWRQKLWNCRFYWLASELIIALSLTDAVVGNNVRAYLTLFH